MPHGEFSKWLMRDEQKELFDALFASVLAVLFLGLSALALWPLGRALMTFRLAKGLCLFAVVLYVTAVLVVLIQRQFRVDIDSHHDAYVISNLAVSGFLQAGWSAFAALTLQDFTAGAPVWVVAILYFVGLLSCYVTFNIVSTLYGGSIYRMVNVLLSLTSFVIFSVWPAGGRLVYGWFFDLF
jgi:lysylphosphatidylglycerol synthetase-like protein (DUF2156 family)